MNLIFSPLTEKHLEEVAILYDAERPVKTSKEKMKETFQKIKNDPCYFLITASIEEEVVGFIKGILHYDLFEDNNPFLTVWSVRVKKTTDIKVLHINYLKK